MQAKKEKKLQNDEKYNSPLLGASVLHAKCETSPLIGPATVKNMRRDKNRLQLSKTSELSKTSGLTKTEVAFLFSHQAMNSGTTKLHFYRVQAFPPANEFCVFFYGGKLYFWRPKLHAISRSWGIRARLKLNS